MNDEFQKPRCATATLSVWVWAKALVAASVPAAASMPSRNAIVRRMVSLPKQLLLRFSAAFYRGAAAMTARCAEL